MKAPKKQRHMTTAVIAVTNDKGIFSAIKYD